MLLDIHLEWCDDKGERLQKLAELGKPLNISLVPVLMLPEHEVFKNGVYRPDYFYNKNILKLLKAIPKDYPHITFGQQGFAHYCPDCFKTKHKTERKFKHDPWHENRCLHGSEKSVEEQFKFMRKGKKVIEDITGASPIIYCSPNHQDDENTKFSVVELKYDYLVTKGIINLPPHIECGLRVLPERKLGQKGEIIYVHYDTMKNDLDKYIDLVRSSRPLSKIEFNGESKYSSLNDKLVTLSKRARDLGLR